MVRHTSFKGKLNCMDFIIRQENFQGDFNSLCDKIGISKVELPYINKTNHKPYCEYYDEETKELIGKSHERVRQLRDRALKKLSKHKDIKEFRYSLKYLL